jgi:anaerobic carbon-monoxide dehydrogenase iron sulfur subunit
MTKAIITLPERCLGCKTCEFECALAHTTASTLVEALYSGAPFQPRVHVEALGDFGMPMQCRHCEDAPCVVVCPTGAVHRVSDRSLVLLDQENCIGCRLCLLVCPFGVIEMARTGKAVVKCDQCIQRTELGQEPACVAGCPTGALQFDEIAEYVRERRRAAAVRVATAGQISGSLVEAHDGPH